MSPRERLLIETRRGDLDAALELARLAERQRDAEAARAILASLPPAALNGALLARISGALETELGADLCGSVERFGEAQRFAVGEAFTTFMAWGRDLASEGTPRVLAVRTEPHISPRRHVSEAFLADLDALAGSGLIEPPLHLAAEPRCVAIFAVPEGEPLTRLAPLPPEHAGALVAELGVLVQRWHAHGQRLGAFGFHPRGIFATLSEDGVPRLRGVLTGWRRAYEHLRELLGEFAPVMPWLGEHIFLAHEEIFGRPAGPASDVYLLGQLLHFLIFGEAPFQAYGGLMKRLRAHMGGNWPELDAPQHLRQLVHDALRPHPAQRPMLGAFIARARGEAVAPPPPSPMGQTPQINLLEEEDPTRRERMRRWLRRFLSDEPPANS